MRSRVVIHGDRQTPNITLKGGRDASGTISDSDKEMLTRGQDIGLFVRDKRDGKQILIPNIHNLTLRVDGKKAVATVEIEVDEVDVTATWLEAITGVQK